MIDRPLTQEEINDIVDEIVDPKEYDNIIWEAEKQYWREKPVDIWTFLYHNNFLGKLFNNNGVSTIYPFWMRILADLYPSPFYTSYNEVLLSLAIGLGKSTITCSAIANYEQYKLLCLKNPASYYGLISNSVIVTALFSTTKELVTDVNWPKMRDGMTISPWFKNRLNLDDTVPKIKSLQLDKNVEIQLGSRTQHAISRDVLIAIVDEGNAGILNDQVKTNYNEIYRRRKSRFESGNRIPGILLACSSPKGQDDFINSRINREKDNPDCLVIDNVAEWDVKNKGFSGKKMVLFLGDEKQDGDVLPDGIDLKQYDEQLLLVAPVEYKAEFKKDFIGAVRDIAGRRTVASTSLFKSKSALSEAFCGPNLFTKDIIELDVRATLEDIKPFISYVNLNMFLQRKYSRFIGIDFGLNNDKFGFAIGYAKYPDGFENKEELTRKYIDKEYIVEGVTSFKAKTKEGVPSAAVREMIRYFRLLGFPIQLITADKPGQVMLQDLLRDNFSVQYLSVDTSRIPYHTLKDQVSLRTIKGPENPLLAWELSHLVDDGHKIDHPMEVIGGWCQQNAEETVPGSKDSSDACLRSSTKVWTKEYGMLSIKDLADKGKDNMFTVLAKDSYGNIVEAKAYNAHKTKSVDKLIRITLSNDKVLECTEDHLIMLKDGSYKQACDLTEDDELADTLS